MRYKEPNLRQTATLVNNLPTCTFAPKPYTRIIKYMKIGNSAASLVFVFRGVLTSPPVAQNIIGANNELRGEIKIPAGQPFFVQWSAAGPNLRDAFANVELDRTDDLDSVIETYEWGPWVDQPDITQVTEVTSLVGVSSVQTDGLHMHSYNSAFLVVTAIVTTGVPTNHNGIDIMMVWSFDANGTIPIFTESYAIFANDQVSVFLNPGGRFMLQDACRGPYLTVYASNRGPDTVSLTIQVFGTARQLDQRIIREGDASVGVFAGQNEVLVLTGNVVTAAGVSSRYPMIMHIGEVRCRFVATTTIHTFDIFDADGFFIERRTVAAGATDIFNFFFPSRTCRLFVTNTGGVAGTHNAIIIGHRQPQ